MELYPPLITAGIVIAFLLFAAHVVDHLGRLKMPGRVIVAVLVALTGLLGTLPSIIEAVKR